MNVYLEYSFTQRRLTCGTYAQLHSDTSGHILGLIHSTEVTCGTYARIQDLCSMSLLIQGKLTLGTRTQHHFVYPRLMLDVPSHSTEAYDGLVTSISLTYARHSSPSADGTYSMHPNSSFPFYIQATFFLLQWINLNIMLKALYSNFSFCN